MIARVVSVLLVGALAMLAFWQQGEVPMTADEAVTELPPGVIFRAARGDATQPFAARWTLAFPETAPAQQELTLDIGVPIGATATGRLTAEPREPAPLLAEIATVFAASADAAAVDAPPSTGLQLTLDLLGERLSPGHGDVGAVVIAGAFVSEPAGDWRVFRVTLGESGPSCFLAINGPLRTALLLPRAVEDGPAILARLRGLLAPPPITD